MLFSLPWNYPNKWTVPLNRVLTHLHTPCHSSGCTSFSALHSCFPFLLTFSIMFLVKFWKRSLMNVLKATNLFLVRELCFGHTVPYTLHLKSSEYIICVLFCRLGMSCFRYFINRNAFSSFSLQLIKRFLNQMGRMEPGWVLIYLLISFIFINWLFD